MNRRPARQPGTGFTLVEVVVVVAIIAIVAAVVVPRFGQTDHTRLRAAARLLAGDLSFAQIQSISHSDDPCVVVIDPATGNYHLASASDTATAIANPIGGGDYECVFGVGRARALTEVAILSHDFDGDDELQFGQFGQLDQPADATVTLGCGSLAVTLTIHTTTGEVTIGNIN